MTWFSGISCLSSIPCAGWGGGGEYCLLCYVCAAILGMTVIIMLSNSSLYVINFRTFPFIVGFFTFIWFSLCINLSETVAYCYYVLVSFFTKCLCSCLAWCSHATSLTWPLFFHSSPKWYYSFIIRTSNAEGNDTVAFHISWLSHLYISHLILARLL
jgi:hypothetical protein